MSQIVMCSGVSGRNRQRSLVERYGIEIPGLSVPGSGSFISKATQDPKTRFERARHQSVVDGFAVGDEFVEVVFVLQEFHQSRADFHFLSFRVGNRTRE